MVEDEDDARMMLETTLRQYGAEVITAASAAEAMDRLDHARPHVLLSDIGMAHEDGDALIRRIRARSAPFDPHEVALLVARLMRATTARPM